MKAYYALLSLSIIQTTLLASSSFSQEAKLSCREDCRKRSVVSLTWRIKVEDREAALAKLHDITQDDLNSCPNTCSNETSEEACAACAQKSIPDEKVAKEKDDMAPFKCADDAPAKACFTVRKILGDVWADPTEKAKAQAEADAEEAEARAALEDEATKVNTAADAQAVTVKSSELAGKEPKSKVISCREECRKRSVVSKTWRLKLDQDAAGIESLYKFYNDDLNTCPNVCNNETSAEDCRTCAQKAISDEKLEQENNIMAALVCADDAPDNQCIKERMILNDQFADAAERAKAQAEADADAAKAKVAAEAQAAQTKAAAELAEKERKAKIVSCREECRKRSAVSTTWRLKKDKTTAALDALNKFSIDDLNNCPNTCSNEVSVDDCKACAQKAIPDEKLEQENSTMAAFVCADDAPDSQCYIERQVLNDQFADATERAKAKAAADAEAAKAKAEADAQAAKAKVEADQKQVQDRAAAYAKSLEAARSRDSGSGPCSKECQQRCAIGDLLMNGQGAQVDAGVNRMEAIFKDNIKNCRNTCVNMPPDTCAACAEATITDAKLAQDKAELDKFACPLNAACTLVQQPIFTYTTVSNAAATAEALAKFKKEHPGQVGMVLPPNASRRCLQACKARLPFNGMKLQGTEQEIKAAKDFMMSLAQEFFPACANACAGKADAECDACALENIPDDYRQNLIDQVNEKYACDRPKEQTAGQIAVEAILSTNPAPCTIIDFDIPLP